MEIKNKLGSKELELNRFLEQLFKYGEENKVLEFLKKYPAPYYAIRDKSAAAGLFKLKVEADKVLKEVQDYKLFTINVSSANYASNQLLVGEIEILSNNDVYAVLTTDPNASVRDALEYPEFNTKTTIFDDDTLNEIPYFNFIYDYIITHELKDIVVEFSLFNKNLGIYRQSYCL